MKKYIIFVKSKDSYPSRYVPITTDGKKYYLGGRNSVYIPIIEGYEQVRKLMYKINKQMSKRRLIFKTTQIK